MSPQKYIPVALLTPEQHAARRAKANAYNRSRPRANRKRRERAYFPPGTPEEVKREHKQRVLKEWQASRPLLLRQRYNNSKMRQIFGITREQFDAQSLLQGGVCAICRRGPGKRRLAIDHCHTTGKLRGLLCERCNTGIGHLGDSPERLEIARRYLLSAGVWGVSR